ncbi:MAG: hypothetical protein HQ581_05450 [Planctomycetes bacterium]|nr:hypothetical protein [Planctomycetota bacterium]
MKLTFDYDEHETTGKDTCLIHGSGRLPVDSPGLPFDVFGSGKPMLLVYAGHSIAAQITRLAELSMGVIVVAVRVESGSFNAADLEGKQFSLEPVGDLGPV